MKDKYGPVESILASVQWDRWQFMLSAPRLVKPDVVVISHSHRDHWARNLPEKDAVFIPRAITIPDQCCSLRNVVWVDYSERLGRLSLIELDQWRLARFLGERVARPHAVWWLASARAGKVHTRVVFMGDADVGDIPTMQRFVEEAFKRDRPMQGAILPSFGGVLNHGAGRPTELAARIETLAYAFRDMYNLTLGALPHPLNAGWADYNATALPSI